MKLALRFALSFVLISVMVWGAASYYRVKREVDLFERDIKRDHETIGLDLAAAVVDIWQLGGEKAAYHFVNQANESRAAINIRLVTSDSVRYGSSTRVGDLIQAAPTGSQQVNHWNFEIYGQEWLFSYVAISGLTNTRTGIELAESLEERDKYVQTTIWRSVFYTTLVGVLAGVIAMVLGVVYVARPVRILTDKARRVARGNLSGGTDVVQKDELGILDNELNSMRGSLAAAQGQIRSESEARQKALEQLRHADRLATVGKLASVVAHELGTPLNAIKMRARMIAEKEIEGSDSIESSLAIVSEASRMAESIRRLLDLSRRRASQRERVDLRQLIQQNITLFEPLARKHKVKLVSVPIGNPVVALVDPEHIRQVLSNLMVNAVEAMPDGGVLTVALQCREKPSSDAAPAAQFGVITVSDTGTGILPEYLEQLFDPFFTTKDRQAGTGLGLSISDDIVREHGGWIEVESSIGRGTTFHVFLPLDKE